MRYATALILLLSAGACAGAGGATGGSGDRLALVVGVSYSDQPDWRLRNTVPDAADVANELRTMGFEVDLQVDPTVQGLQRAVRQLAGAAKAKVKLFYYAGHGLQIDGGNYLVAEVNEAPTVVGLDDVIETVSKPKHASLFFFDACRRPPYADRGNLRIRKTALRGIVRSDGAVNTAKIGGRIGLAETLVNAPNTFIMYSTAPNTAAADGEGRNSPFAQSFLENVGRRNANLDAIATGIARGTKTRTQGRQEPWISKNAFSYDIFLRPRAVRKVAG